MRLDPNPKRYGRCLRTPRPMVTLRLQRASLMPLELVADIDIKRVVVPYLVFYLLVHPVQFVWSPQCPQVEMLPLGLDVFTVERRRWTGEC